MLYQPPYEFSYTKRSPVASIRDGIRNAHHCMTRISSYR
jgi:hypothetical protein